MVLPISLAEISVPDSELAQKATRLVAEVSPKFLYHHCLRTYLFGEILGRRDTLNYDPELLYLSAVMHDLGLTEQFDGEQRFEVDGADAARAFVTEHGLPEEKAELVWDAIALHTSIGIASRKQPEIALVQLGASLDVFGLQAEAIAPETLERVIDAYPRQGFNKALTELLVSQVKRKPQVVPFTWLAEVGRCHIHGFVCPSYQDLLRQSPFPE
ncbi:MAG TPA: HD domain-containing protein [Candidatus Caenarcaniphilales bacterium]